MAQLNIAEKVSLWCSQFNLSGLLNLFVLPTCHDNIYHPVMQVLFGQLFYLDGIGKFDKHLVA